MNISYPRDPKYASYKDILKFFLIAMSPKLAKLLDIYFFDKEISYFFVNIIRKTIENRRSELNQTLLVCKFFCLHIGKVDTGETTSLTSSLMSLTRNDKTCFFQRKILSSAYWARLSSSSSRGSTRPPLHSALSSSASFTIWTSRRNSGRRLKKSLGTQTRSPAII